MDEGLRTRVARAAAALVVTCASSMSSCVSSTKSEVWVRNAEDPIANYAASVHSKVHPIWSQTPAFLRVRDLGYIGPTHSARVLVGIEPNGALGFVNLNEPSGDAYYDAEALRSLRAAAPFAPTPSALRACDGRLYFRWSFRDDAAADGLFYVRYVPRPCRRPG